MKSVPSNTQLTEDFAKEIELDKMRMDLASNMSLVSQATRGNA